MVSKFMNVSFYKHVQNFKRFNADCKIYSLSFSWHNILILNINKAFGIKCLWYINDIKKSAYKT